MTATRMPTNNIRQLHGDDGDDDGDAVDDVDDDDDNDNDNDGDDVIKCQREYGRRMARVMLIVSTCGGPKRVHRKHTFR